MSKKLIYIIVAILILSLGIYKIIFDRFEFKELSIRNGNECLIKVDKIIGNSCTVTEGTCERHYNLCQ